MKSFGVRLAAGALTILFGAYAAAIAQKDKDSEPDNWSAEAPQLGQPAAPIADIGEQTWISEPDSSQPDPAQSLGQQETLPQSRVQLVQHTESPAADGPQSSVGIAALPTDFDAEAAAADAAFATDSAFSPESAAEVTDAPAPDWTSEIPTAATADTTGSPKPMTLPSEQANGLPELEIGGGPTMGFPESASPRSMTAGPADGPATAALGQPTNALGEPASFGGAIAQPGTEGPGTAGPENVLRGSPNEANLLRSGPVSDAPPVSDAAPAFDPTGAGAPQFEASPMQTWDHENANATAELSNAPAPFVPDGQANQLPAVTPNFEAQPEPSYPQPQAAFADPSIASHGAPVGQPTPADDQLSNQPVDYQQAPRSAAINPDLAIDAPGERRLEGAQTPSIVIQKRAPSEVKVGQTATFAIHVQNVGAVEALDVKVHDMIPSGMELVDATPRPLQQGKRLLWQLGAMPAGDEQTISMQLIPRQEGELGSVARVSFEAAASVRTIATRPELKIVQRAPETVLIGQQLEIELEVSNPGTGEATNVVLQEDVPQGLEHPKGRQLDNAIGNLAPGEIRRQVLRMKAVAPGIIENSIRLTGDDGLVSEHSVQVQVVAPELRVDLEGPTRRFLERQATYYVHVGNVGTADAHNVELSVQLDRGFTFVSTENQGQYDPSRHSVHWSVAQMPAGEAGKVALTLLPVQEGEQAITLDARADLGVVAKNERRLSVEGFSELSFSITNPGGPIELGTETTYEIRVNNSGSKADSNIRLAIQLPPGLELISAQGDAGTDGRGRVEFQPKATLSPGTEHGYKIRVRGVAPGTHIVKAVVVSDLATTPVTKEESTVVYADR